MKKLIVFAFLAAVGSLAMLALILSLIPPAMIATSTILLMLVGDVVLDNRRYRYV